MSIWKKPWMFVKPISWVQPFHISFPSFFSLFSSAKYSIKKRNSCCIYATLQVIWSNVCCPIYYSWSASQGCMKSFWGTIKYYGHPWSIGRGSKESYLIKETNSLFSKYCPLNVFTLHWVCCGKEAESVLGISFWFYLISIRIPLCSKVQNKQESATEKIPQTTTSLFAWKGLLF